MNLISEDYLIHYGVKGMKWGVRHDNEKYSQDQRLRDSRVYGSSGVRRINNSMNKGYSISGARSKESDRINAARRRSVIAGQVGSTLGTVAGGLVGWKTGTNLRGFTNTRTGRSVEFSPEERMIISGALSTGAATVGKQLGRYGGQSISMLMSGYSYRKFR